MWLMRHSTQLEKTRASEIPQNFEICPFRQNNTYIQDFVTAPYRLEPAALKCRLISSRSHVYLISGPGLALRTYLPPTANSSQIGYIMYSTWKKPAFTRYTNTSSQQCTHHSSQNQNTCTRHSRGRKSFATERMTLKIVSRKMVQCLWHW